MSWSQWPHSAVPQPPPAPTNSGTVCGPPVSVASAGISYSPSVPPPTSYTPAQFAALPAEQQYAIQQNWQQWQTYHQQYAQWHAQYGEQYQREMQAKLGIVAPTLPFVPPIPPYATPVASNVSVTYSVPPPPPVQATSFVSVPNISAAASQPPPPPPPPEECSVKKDIQGSLQGASSDSKLSLDSQNMKSQGCEKERLTKEPYMHASYDKSSRENLRYDNRSQQWKANADSRYFGGNDRNRDNGNDSRNARNWVGNDNDVRRRNNWQFFNQHSSKEKLDQSRSPAVPFNEKQQSEHGTEQHKKNPIKEDDEDKTPEERAFDEQFRKWEEEFENWKRQNANHPDKQAYNEYEMKFEDCRRKLLERRELMRKRKLERKLKQDQERRLKEQENNVPSTSEHCAKGSLVDKKSSKICDDSDSKECNNFKKEEEEKRPDLQKYDNRDPEEQVSENLEFLKTTKTEGIPGLDLVSSADEKGRITKSEEATEVIDLDPDTKLDREESALLPSTEKNRDLVGSVVESANVSQDESKVMSIQLEQEQSRNNEIPSLLSQKFEKPVLSPDFEEEDGTDHIEDDHLNNNITQDFIGENSFNRNVASLSSMEGRNTRKDNRLAGGVTDGGNVPTGIAELANALSDPNVLALITAAIGSNSSRTENNTNSSDNQVAPFRISPWMVGQEPFQNQNQYGMQNFNNRDLGSANNSSYWQDSGSFKSQPWENRNTGDSRGNQNSWQKYSGRQSDFRRTAQNWQFNRDSTGRGDSAWHDDIDMRQNVSERNNAMGKLDEKNRCDEGMPNRERVNPFKDHDDRGYRTNTFLESNDCERGQQHQDRRGRSRSTSNNRDRSRSSGRSGDQDDNFPQRFHCNPFKTGTNIFDNTLDPSNIDRSGGNDEYFRPTHVIDYQNKSLDSDIPSNDILLPRKVVDYCHKPSANNIDAEEKNDFFPMKTIDYGHSSVKSELENNNEGRKNDFHAGKNRNRNRNRNKKSGLQESNPTYPGTWSLVDQTPRQRPGLPTKRGKRRDSNYNGDNLLNKSEFATKSLIEKSATYASYENFDEISEDE